MTLALLLLAACAGDVVLTPGQDGCTNYDFSNPADSTIEFEVSDDGSGRVWRSYAVQEQSGLFFDPVIEGGGTVVKVYEKWAGGETDDAFCYAPYVAFEGLTGKMTVEWYLEEGDGVPFDSVEIKAK